MHDRRTIVAGVLAAATAGCGTREGDDGTSVPALARDGTTDLASARQTPGGVESQCPPGVNAQGPSRSWTVPGLNSISWCSLSPDGRTLLVRANKELRFFPLDGGDPLTVPLGGPSLGVMDAEGSLAWSSDSRSVWLLAGETSRSGWVTGPLACARRGRDGRLISTPPLRGLPGRLDQVTWVDGNGLGLAHLDTRGGYNRPELPDANPALAVIEAGRGRVRDVLPLRRAIIETWGEGSGSLYLRVPAVARTADGRVRALMQLSLLGVGPTSRVGGWALWTEGERLRRLPDGFGEQLTTFAFTPNAERLLAGHHLSASGIIMEHRPSPPPTPVTGPYAALYDLAGRAIWTLSGTATEMRGRGLAAVSGDGRQGLVLLPGTCGRHQLWGVVDLRRGRIVRRLELPTRNSVVSNGFHGRKPWIASYHQLNLFA